MSELFTPKERLLTPPAWTGIDESLPVVFIGGPVEGAYDFQTPLAHRIIKATKDVFVASPRADLVTERGGVPNRSTWQTANIGRAAFNGVVSFWFAARERHRADERHLTYGDDSVAEFLAALEQMTDRPSVHVQIGVDPDYPASGGRSGFKIFHAARTHGLAVHSSIDDLQEAVVAELV